MKQMPQYLTPAISPSQQPSNTFYLSDVGLTKVQDLGGEDDAEVGGSAVVIREAHALATVLTF